MILTLPDEIIDSSRLSRAEILRELAVNLFQQDRLTLGQASQLAEMTQWEFRLLLGSRQIPLHYDVEELEEDLKTIAKLRGQ